MGDLNVLFGLLKGFLIELWFFLIPEFVSVNFQLELIVRDKLWLLQMFFFNVYTYVYFC